MAEHMDEKKVNHFRSVTAEEKWKQHREKGKAEPLIYQYCFIYLFYIYLKEFKIKMASFKMVNIRFGVGHEFLFCFVLFILFYITEIFQLFKEKSKTYSKKSIELNVSRQLNFLFIFLLCGLKKQVSYFLTTVF